MPFKKIRGNWWEKGFFDRTMSQILFGTAKLKLAVKEVKWIIKTLGIKPPAKILDVGCGVGRHLIPLAKNGFQELVARVS